MKFRCRVWNHSTAVHLVIPECPTLPMNSEHWDAWRAGTPCICYSCIPGFSIGGNACSPQICARMSTKGVFFFWNLLRAGERECLSLVKSAKLSHKVISVSSHVVACEDMLNQNSFLLKSTYPCINCCSRPCECNGTLE